MKIFNKALAVLLALALCCSMAAPAFAASFADLSNAISDKDSYYRDPAMQDNEWLKGKDLGGRYGYGNQIEGSGRYEIEAWDGQDGTRNVEVNTSITATEDESSILIEGGKKVDLKLNGSTITGNGSGSVFRVAGGDPDATETEAPGELTVHGGTISGGGGTAPQEGPADAPKQGGGIYVGENAKLTLDNTKVTGNTAGQGGGVYADAHAAVRLQNGAKVSGNGTDDVYLNDGAGINTPDGGSWADGAGKSHRGSVEAGDGGLSLTWTESGGNPGSNPGGSTATPGATPSAVEIENPEIPLSQGPTSCAEFIYKMWVLGGEPAPLDDRGLPEGVDEGHEYASAIAWAASAGIVPMDTFDAEALLTVALVKEYLSNFAAYADMAMPELTTLTGEDDDLVVNSDDILDEFFGVEDGE